MVYVNIKADLRKRNIDKDEFFDILGTKIIKNCYKNILSSN